MTNEEIKQLDRERKSYLKSQTKIPEVQNIQPDTQNVAQLSKEMVELKQKFKDLEKKVDDSNRLQRDFSGIQIFDREIQFKSKVRNAAGTVVIN